MSKKVQKFHFYLDKQVNPQEKEKIFLVANFYGNRIKYDTKERIEPSLWNKEMERCIEGNHLNDRQNRETKRINKRLNIIMGICLDEFNLHYKYYGKDAAWDKLTRTFKLWLRVRVENKDNEAKREQEKKETKPLEYFEQYILNMNKRVNKRTLTFVGEGTKGHHTLVYKRIKSYIETQHKSNSFTLFNEEFEKDFELWGLSEKKYSPNTVVATFSVLKVWLNQAEKEGLITDKAYHSYKSKGTTSDEIYLTDDEIKRIFQIDFKNEDVRKQIDEKSQIEQTRDLFIISCHTGLRYSDLKYLNTKGVWDMTKGAETLIFQTTKTDKEVIIPLHSNCIAIYKKYKGKFPKPIDKTHSIRQLKKIGEIAEVNDEIQLTKNRGGITTTIKYKKYEQIKNHTGRRSFCTNLFLKGMPTLSIMKMSGHTTEENFMKYIKISNKQNADINRKFFAE